jgi:hypothetical protein
MKRGYSLLCAISGGEVIPQATLLVHSYDPVAGPVLCPALKQQFIASVDTQPGFEITVFTTLLPKVPLHVSQAGRSIIALPTSGARSRSKTWVTFWKELCVLEVCGLILIVQLSRKYDIWRQF